MIYVTVGNHYQGFLRLVEAMDRWAAAPPLPVRIQYGHTRALLRYASGVDFLTPEEADRCIADARLVVAHAGIGTIISARRFGTPLLIVPRRRRYAEHMNDHQLEVAQAVEGHEGITVLWDLEGLGGALEQMLNGPRRAPSSRGRRDQLINEIKAFLAQACGEQVGAE